MGNGWRWGKQEEEEEEEEEEELWHSVNRPRDLLCRS